MQAWGGGASEGPEGLAHTLCEVKCVLCLAVWTRFALFCALLLPCFCSLFMCLVSCLVSGPSLGPSLCLECAGIGPKWAKQLPRVPSYLSYCEYCLYFDLFVYFEGTCLWAQYLRPLSK